MHENDSSGSVDGGAETLPADARDYVGNALVDESSILSPGVYGRVFNPIVVAEFRRWRARPFTYTGIVFITFLAICFVYFSQARSGPPFGIDHPFLLDLATHAANLRALLLQPFLPATSPSFEFADRMLNLVLRPSTILPLMMVWRALSSFRDGGLYRPFRTTFLTPSEFLWGMIAVPFFVSALILVVYTGGILGPGIVQGYNSMMPTYARPAYHPVATIMGILFEGGLNGALICFIALFCGLMWNARLEALVPVVLCILAIQALQCTFQISQDKFFEWLTAFAASRGGGDPFAEPTRLQAVVTTLGSYKNLSFLGLSGAAKLPLCVAAWMACRVRLRRTEDDIPMTPRQIFRALQASRRVRRARSQFA